MNVYFHDDDLFTNFDDSNSKNSSNRKQKPSKAKPIKKKNKSKQKFKEVYHVTKKQINNQSLSNFFVSLCFFQSQQQKFKRVQSYFQQDIQNYFKIKISQDQIHKFLNIYKQNQIKVTDLIKSNMIEIWKDYRMYYEQMINYFDLAIRCQKYNNCYLLFQNKQRKKNYCCFRNKKQFIVYQINKLQMQLLKQRKIFFNPLQQKIKDKYNKNIKLPSQLSLQILFLFKNLCKISKKIKFKFQKIISQLHNTIQKEITPSYIIEDKYCQYLICKLMLDGFQTKKIDTLNYFKNNQKIQYGTKETSIITDQKQFQQFLKKKKHKKGKKSRQVLHTACLGCFSILYQQYNPFLYCQQCYVRFHRLCYTPKEDGLCQQCYVKKIKGRFNQCQICSTKGLISVSTKKSIYQTEKYVHIFCMLVHGQWKVYKGRLKHQKQNFTFINLSVKCILCQIQAQYFVECQNCNKVAHASCGFLNGWNFSGKITQSNKLQIIVKCCKNINLQENSRFRKFTTNYRKQAYLY